MSIKWKSLALGAVVALTMGCGSGDPFHYVPVSGKIAYEDGSNIEASRLMLRFVSQSPPIDGQEYPRPGMAEVNLANGTFNEVTSTRFGDGLVPGVHKVVIQVESGTVPLIYTDSATTPLTVDTAQAPFDLKIAR